MAKKALKAAGKTAKTAAKGVTAAATLASNLNLLWLKVKLIVIAVIALIILAIFLVSAVRIVIESIDDKIKDAFSAAFPEIAGGATSGEGNSGALIESAKKIHDYVRTNGYSYGSNSASVYDEPTSLQQKRVDCSTYVDWVLKDAGIGSLPTRWCPDLPGQLNSSDFLENIGTDENQAKAGDIVLFEGHIQIYAGGGNWYNCGSDQSIQTEAPSTVATGFEGGRKCWSTSWHI